MDPKVPSSIRVAFVIEGTRGDVQPYVALALRMQARGNVVKIFSNIDHKSLCESFGLDFEGPLYSMSKAMERPDIKEAFAKGKAMKIQSALTSVRMENLGDNLKMLWPALSAFEPTVLFTGQLSRAKALAWSVTYSIPMFNVELQVMLPVSDKGMAGLPTLPFRLNRWWMSLLAAGAKSAMAKVKKTFKVSLNVDLNGKLELPYLLAFISDDLIPSVPAPCCYGVSKLVVPPHPEWPKTNFHQCGFFIVDQQTQEQMMKDSANGSHFGAESSDELTKFLAAGKPPAYLGWGSLVCNSPQWMVELAVESLKHAGARGVLLGGWAGLALDAVPARLQDFCRENIIFVKSAPHEWLFPQCACLVHHGGCGTTAASVRSGRPTIITPIMGDQFEFAASMNEIGCGIGMAQLSGITSTKLGDAIKSCMEKESIISKAKDIGSKLCAEDGCANFLRIFDDWLSSDFLTQRWLKKHNDMLNKCRASYERSQSSVFSCCTSKGTPYRSSRSSDTE
eukprot:TRINITY_DN106769_c0_g1_i1.p1 TRINITY_DN106769_c0_g1~~TRINITY_DN106769_c0_g1_i1.p1  ORF type:complete len:507 (+),score=64.34 TRINITY_DN106769_c0_g1_i1:80-1600(+)